MLRITDDRARGSLVLEPTGSLNRGDLDRLSAAFDVVVATTGRAPNLLIHAPRFPAWADFHTLLQHLRFIRQRHRAVARVALVSDARALDVASFVARRLLATRIRVFGNKDLEAARAWVAGDPPKAE